MFRHLLVIFCVFISQAVLAHEDIDIGIEEVRLNKNCIAEITLVNSGRTLPASFYRAGNSANIKIEKSNYVESLGSLRFLDKAKELSVNGGRLKIFSKKTYANMPQPIKVTLSFFDEFLDYGGDNNTKTEAIDCILGKGQIEGEKILPSQPDLTIEQAVINPQTCHIEAVFKNLTSVSLNKKAWDREHGAVVIQLDLETHVRLRDTLLIEFDPQKSFTKNVQSLPWKSRQPITGVRSLRIALWRVGGDSNFDNNHRDLNVPQSCW